MQSVALLIFARIVRADARGIHMPDPLGVIAIQSNSYELFMSSPSLLTSGLWKLLFITLIRHHAAWPPTRAGPSPACSPAPAHAAVAPRRCGSLQPGAYAAAVAAAWAWAGGGLHP
jgi:hypothetical protein